MRINKVRFYASQKHKQGRCSFNSEWLLYLSNWPTWKQTEATYWSNVIGFINQTEKVFEYALFYLLCHLAAIVPSFRETKTQKLECEYLRSKCCSVIYITYVCAALESAWVWANKSIANIHLWKKWLIIVGCISLFKLALIFWTTASLLSYKKTRRRLRFLQS